MGSQAREELADDHRSVGALLEQLLTDLANQDARSSHAHLDLLWARLAVHIRAEHLHLFPTVLNRVAEQAGASQLSEAQAMVERLREDHDFFMRGLAGAIAVLREIPTENDEASLLKVANTVREIERRLIFHNEIEENHIYRWASTILTDEEQRELTTRIDAELENRPQRFSIESWAKFR
jgi:hemerythrin superfamily protein